ncbi:hypothetical protein Cgig2_017796 [Carnegiea gigantea]|uniref:Uncharacterized protein n=1 Tax=Carnegiea gigantea TaxID=171969 RepID=A0A9Q1KYI1_9CARY|nr:hypothetical protein Cgig2_017796 [Carnegiea gigantea]
MPFPSVFPCKYIALPPSGSLLSPLARGAFSDPAAIMALPPTHTAAAESGLPEIVQATFYAMLLNDMLELGAVHEYTVEKMSGDIREGQAGPQVEGRHPQFSNLPALIDGQVMAEVPRQNKCREPKKIPYAVPIFEPGTPSWSSCEYSSTPSILSPEVEVTHPWEITIANYVPAFQGPRRPPLILALPQSGSPRSATGHSSRSSFSDGASTSASPPPSLRPGSSVPKRKDRAPRVNEIVTEGSEFPEAPTRLDPQDGLGSHFPDPKAVAKLKRLALEKQHLLPAEYSFIIHEPDATVNEPPAKCIAAYRVVLSYDIRFPLHPVIREILNKYELAPAQIVPTSWHNIYSFIVTCELRGLTYQARAQLTVFETGDATPEQVAAAVERKPAVSLPVHKKQRTEEQPNKMGASAPSSMRDERTGQPAVLLSESWSSGDQTPARPGHSTISKAPGTATMVTGSASSLPVRPSTNFIKADPDVRLSLVQDIVKSCDLATSGASDPPKGSEEEMAMAEVFAQGVKAVAECQWLEGLFSRRQRCYEKLQADLEGREFLDDRYYEPYLRFVDEREQAVVEGRDLEEVEFISPSSEGDAAEDEATNPLEAEAGAFEEEGRDDGGEPTRSPPAPFIHVCFCFMF